MLATIANLALLSIAAYQDHKTREFHVLHLAAMVAAGAAALAAQHILWGGVDWLAAGLGALLAAAMLGMAFAGLMGHGDAPLYLLAVFAVAGWRGLTPLAPFAVAVASVLLRLAVQAPVAAWNVAVNRGKVPGSVRGFRKIVLLLRALPVPVEKYVSGRVVSPWLHPYVLPDGKKLAIDIYGDPEEWRQLVAERSRGGGYVWCVWLSPLAAFILAGTALVLALGDSWLVAFYASILG